MIYIKKCMQFFIFKADCRSFVCPSSYFHPGCIYEIVNKDIRVIENVLNVMASLITLILKMSNRYLSY